MADVESVLRFAGLVLLLHCEVSLFNNPPPEDLLFEKTLFLDCAVPYVEWEVDSAIMWCVAPRGQFKISSCVIISL